MPQARIQRAGTPGSLQLVLGLSTLPSPGFRREDGGCTRIRTLDPLIKSQLLYQLSYAPLPDGALRPRGEGAENTGNRVERKGVEWECLG